MIDFTGHPCSCVCSSVSDTVNPAAMDAPVSMTLSACSYGCSNVNDTVNPVAMDAPVLVTLATLQLWML